MTGAAGAPSAQDTEDRHGRATYHEWLGLVVIVLCCVLVAMDISVLFYAVPFVAADLAPTTSEVLWVMDIYGFLLAGLLITMGALGDRIGRRRLLMLGAAGFGVASVLAAYSTSPGQLIASRALLGVAGATLAPSTLSLIRNMFHDEGQRRAAIGLWTAGFAAGAMLGPITAGVLLEHFWWGSVFLINVPVMLLALALGPILLPEYRSPSPERFDLFSAALSLAAVLPVVYGAKRFAEGHFDARAVASVVAGLVIGVLFIRRQRRSPDPLIDPKLFRDRAFSTAIATTTVVQFAMLGMMMLTSQYALSVLGLRPLVASLWQLPAVGTLFVGLAVAGVLAQRVRPAVVVCTGLVLAAVGFAVMSPVGPDDGLGLIVTGASVMTFGVGMVVLLATDIVVATAPRERAGSASALSETSNEFGGAVGIAMLGSIALTVYRNEVEDVVPAGLPPEAAEATRSTLQAAVEVAKTLPDPVGPALKQGSVEAFTDGLQVAVLTGSAILMVVAVAAAIALRPVRIGSGDADGAEGSGGAVSALPATADGKQP
ncbi:MFS transporter [Streptomyces sp. NPDC002328]|uniref:MFS transporter n=1 Tax=Streptomyces sp. NPDC002328 TaxID=3364642 RepID=UPI00368AAC00